MSDSNTINQSRQQHLHSDYHKNVCVPSQLNSRNSSSVVQVDENDTLDTNQLYNNINNTDNTDNNQENNQIDSSNLSIQPVDNDNTTQRSSNTPTHKHTHSLTCTPNHRSSRVNSITSYCTSPIHRNKCGEALCCVHSSECEYDGYHWYFATGSMCNPTSLKLRGITPIESYPAILRGWRIVFDGTAGMANVMEDSNASFHGVLHRITHDEMIVLDKIEGSYDRLPVTAELYDKRQQCATVYKMDENKLDRSKPPGLPSERYIDIITQGLKHFNADVNYINWLQHQPCIPRKQSADYAKLILPCNNCREYTLDELSQYDGRDGRDLLIAVNGKVLKWIGDLNNPSTRMQHDYIQQRYAGTDVTFKWSRMLYEPKYRIATCYNEMQSEHKAWVEDMFAERFQANEQPNYECVGILTDTHNINEQYIQQQNNKYIDNNHNNDNQSQQSSITTTQQTIHTLSGDLTVTQSESHLNKL